MVTVNSAPTFRVGDGAVSTSVGSGSSFGSDVVVQADGRIVVGGGIGFGTGLLALRYNADGTLDETFGEDGEAVTAIDSRGSGRDILLQPDGKIILGGLAGSPKFPSLGFARFNADGSLDTTFKGGKFEKDVAGGNNWISEIALQADGKFIASLVIGYEGGGDLALVRFNADGTLDKTFGDRGKVVTEISTDRNFAEDLLIQADGKIVLTATSTDGTDSDFPTRAFSGLIRFNADGSLDTGFGQNGKVVAKIDAPYSGGFDIVQPADGKLLQVSHENDRSKDSLVLVRYNVDGSLDASFGKGGRAETGGVLDYVSDIVLQPDGKIVVVGDYAVARFNADGSLDTGFGDNGSGAAGLGSGAGIASVTLQADGKIVLTGSVSAGGDPADVLVMRLDADGSPDRSFDVRDTLGGSVNSKVGKTVVLDKDVSVDDAELAAQGNYGGATITLSRSGGAQADDVFGASGTLARLTEGGALTVGGKAVGTVAQNSGGALVLAFDANATQPLVDAALRQITYKNASAAAPASVKIEWLFDDGNTAGAQGAGGALSGSGFTTVTLVNDAPKITSGNGREGASVFAPENQTYLTRLQASDVDGDKVTWSITGGADEKLFKINARTGEIYFRSAPDFEAPNSRAKSNTYEVAVTASDGERTDSQLLKAKVSNQFGVQTPGTKFADSYVGSAEADSLGGMGRNDTLKGMGGNDRLTGGNGADELYGGDGRKGMGDDTFVFTALSDSTVSAMGRDTIYDFGKGDRIDLSEIDASTKAGNDQAFRFIGDEDFHRKAGELRFENRGSDTYIHADVNGDGEADFAIRLDDVVDLAKADFVL